MPVVSRTFTVKSRRILHDPDLASVIIRLSMAMNDIGMANNGLGEWTARLRNPTKKARQSGGRLYYGRMLMSHVFEALDIIKEIRSNSKLMAAVRASDPQTRASFSAVAKFLSSRDFGLLAQIRNSALRANWKHGHFSRAAKAERSRLRAAILAVRHLRDSI
jgi:hypothetical protein